jgi:hypothetical protein
MMGYGIDKLNVQNFFTFHAVFLLGFLFCPADGMACSSEIFVGFKELHCVMSQKIEVLICWYCLEAI